MAGLPESTTAAKGEKHRPAGEVDGFSPTKVTTNKTLFRQLSFVLSVIDGEFVEVIDGEPLCDCRQATITLEES